jgi:hypothetical protein
LFGRREAETFPKTTHVNSQTALTAMGSENIQSRQISASILSLV